MSRQDKDPQSNHQTQEPFQATSTSTANHHNQSSLPPRIFPISLRIRNVSQNSQEEYKILTQKPASLPIRLMNNITTPQTASSPSSIFSTSLPQFIGQAEGYYSTVCSNMREILNQIKQQEDEMHLMEGIIKIKADEKNI